MILTAHTKFALHCASASANGLNLHSICAKWILCPSLSLLTFTSYIHSLTHLPTQNQFTMGFHMYLNDDLPGYFITIKLGLYLVQTFLSVMAFHIFYNKFHLYHALHQSFCFKLKLGSPKNLLRRFLALKRIRIIHLKLN